MELARLIALMLPFLSGLLGFVGAVKMIARKHRLRFGWAVLAWGAFVVASFAGEILAHVLFRPVFADLGDNPNQTAGWAIAVCASFVVCPYLYFRLKSAQRKETPDRGAGA